MAGRAGSRRNWAVLPLAALAGCVDSIGWLRLDELFVSFISGTTTLLGLALTSGRTDRAVALGTVVGLFAAGALAGSAIGFAAGKAWRPPAVLALVAGLLVSAWRLPLDGPGDGAGPQWALAMVPAMGALNAAIPGVGGITFVTGSLTRFAEALVAAVAGAGPSLAWAPQIGVWAALLAGAAGGAALEARLGQHAVGVSAAAAALAALAALAASVAASRR